MVATFADPGRGRSVVARSAVPYAHRMTRAALEPMMRSNKEVAVIWLLSIAIGLLVPAAPVDYLIARHTTSVVDAVPVQVRPGRSWLS